MLKFLAAILVVLSASAQANSQDSEARLSITTDGLSIDEVVLTSGDEILNTNQFRFQSIVVMNFQNVGGLSMKDNNAHVGCSMELLNPDRESILRYDDLFAEAYPNGLDYNEAKFLTVSLNIGNPLEIQQDHIWNVRIWDKIGKGGIRVEMGFKVIPPEDNAGISIATESLEAKYIYITNENGAVRGNEVSYGEKLRFNFQDISGFSVKQGKVYPGASIMVVDSSGKTVLEYTDLFAAYGDGVNPEAASSLNLSLTVGDPMRISETYLWKTRVWDKKSPAALNAEATLVVLE